MAALGEAVAPGAAVAASEASAAVISVAAAAHQNGKK